jgi:hypothetical protein
MKTVFKLTKSVNSYGNAHNKNKVIFCDLGLAISYINARVSRTFLVALFVHESYEEGH